MGAKSVIVTGATGFVGSHLTRRMLQEGFQVHAFCRATARFDRLADVRRRLHVHTVSLDDRSALRRAVRAIAPDYVLHLAAAVRRGGVGVAPVDLVRTNALATINLIDACDELPYAGFVNTGDAFEYGRKRRAARETDRCRPQTLDGKAKLMATAYARHAALACRKPIVTLRLFSVFGAMDHPSRFVPQAVASALRGVPLRASSPEIARDYVYVDDVVDLYLRAMAAAARHPGVILNAGSGRATTLGELVDAAGAIARRRLEVLWGAYPLAAHDRGCWTADVAKTRELLGWAPRYSLERGLREVFRHMANGDRQVTGGYSLAAK
jgi:nucleoside-diphosphate-sugar epimerase